MFRHPVLVVAALIAVLAIGGLAFVNSVLTGYRDAFLYAFGPYEFARSVQEMSFQRPTQTGLFNQETLKKTGIGWSQGPYLNRHLHNRNLVDHTSRTVTTPNNDTLYTSAVLELSVGPVEIVIPETGTRYLSVALMDIFSDQFAHIGPDETRGTGGTYWIIGPEDTSSPPDGIPAIHATSNDVWLLARTFVSGPDDLPAARTVQGGISVAPVFPDRAPKPFQTIATDLTDAENFLALTNEVLGRSPTHRHTIRAGTFRSVGIDPGNTEVWNSLSGFRKRIWQAIAPRAEISLKKQVESRVSAQGGWGYPPGNLGNYGADDATRAAVSLTGFGALRPEHALYFRSTATVDRAALDGRTSYEMVIPAEGVPANAFWSLALYEPDDTGRFFFFDNPTGRYSVNSASPELRFQPDGRLILSLGPDRPDDETHVWLPTPDGPFAAFFRVYMPDPSALDTAWMPPEITRK